MIPLFKPFVSKKAIKEAVSVLKSGKLTQGAKVNEFEKNLANYFNIDHNHIITTNSATSAIHLVTHILKKPIKDFNWPGMNENDEVITTPLTCVATNLPFIHEKLKLVYADTNPKTINIDIDSILNNLTSKTKLIMLMHWGGSPVNYLKLEEGLKQHEKLYGYKPIVIQDCAHAFGAELFGEKIGKNPHCIYIFSLQAIKHVTSVDGGFIIWQNDFYAKKSRLLRWYGIDRDEKGRNDFRAELPMKMGPGFKYHMNDLSASIGNANLLCLDKILKRRRSIANQYLTQIKNPRVQFQRTPQDCKSAYWLFTILVDNKINFIEYMNNLNIMTSKVHERNDIHDCLKFNDNLSNLNLINDKIVCIPMGTHLSNRDIKKIIKTINNWKI